MDTNVYEITPYTFRKIEYPNRRMNLLVPSINAEHVFGGISTALKFFDTLVKALGYDARIILVDAEPDKAAIKKYSDEYTFVKAEDGETDLCVYHASPYDEIVGDPLYDPNRHAMVMKVRYDENDFPVFEYQTPVSYTHLTLPTT